MMRTFHSVLIMVSLAVVVWGCGDSTGEQEIIQDTAEAPDDGGADTAPPQTPTPAFATPVSGGGTRSSANYRLTVTVGGVAGTQALETGRYRLRLGPSARMP